jgi:SAM-dependent methyltransferase
MTLAEEYEKQNQWRNWPSYLNQIPIKETEIVLDMGCGAGYVTRLLAERSFQAIGVDNNQELRRIAKDNNYLSNASFINSDLSEINLTAIPVADGIWSSFTAAYFPDFQPVLSTWLQYLKPGGWIALIDINHLFGHHPLSNRTETLIKAHCKKLREQLTYDFEMGSKLNHYLAANGLTIIFEQNINNTELVFNGPAGNLVLTFWKGRFDRMTGFQNALGKSRFRQVKNEFIECIRDSAHRCDAIVKFIIAKKDKTI